MRNFVSILLICVLVVITPVLLLVTSVRYNVVTPRFLKRELLNRNVYQLALSQIDEQIQKLVIDPQYPITHAEISNIVHHAFTPQWLQGNVETTVDHFFAWLNAPSSTVLTLPIDLRQPKTVLLADIDAFLAVKLPTIQPCPDKHRPREEQGLCQFAGLTVPQLKEQLKQAGLDLATIGTTLPDTLDLLNPDLSKIVGVSATSPGSAQEKSQEILRRLELVKAHYHQAIQYFLLAWLGFGVLVGSYIALNATQGRRRFIRWIGVLAVSIGVFPLAMGIAAKIILEQKVLPQIHFSADIPTAVQDVVPQLIRDLQHALFLTIGITGACLIVLGLASIIGAHWLPKPVLAKK